MEPEKDSDGYGETEAPLTTALPSDVAWSETQSDGMGGREEQERDSSNGFPASDDFGATGAGGAAGRTSSNDNDSNQPREAPFPLRQRHRLQLHVAIPGSPEGHDGGAQGGTHRAGVAGSGAGVETDMGGLPWSMGDGMGSSLSYSGAGAGAGAAGAGGVAGGELSPPSRAVDALIGSSVESHGLSQSLSHPSTHPPSHPPASAAFSAAAESGDLASESDGLVAESGGADARASADSQGHMADQGRATFAAATATAAAAAAAAAATATTAGAAAGEGETTGAGGAGREGRESDTARTSTGGKEGMRQGAEAGKSIPPGGLSLPNSIHSGSTSKPEALNRLGVGLEVFPSDLRSPSDARSPFGLRSPAGSSDSALPSSPSRMRRRSRHGVPGAAAAAAAGGVAGAGGTGLGARLSSSSSSSGTSTTSATTSSIITASVPPPVPPLPHPGSSYASPSVGVEGKDGSDNRGSTSSSSSSGGGGGNGGDGRSKGGSVSPRAAADVELNSPSFSSWNLSTFPLPAVPPLSSLPLPAVPLPCSSPLPPSVLPSALASSSAAAAAARSAEATRLTLPAFTSSDLPWRREKAPPPFTQPLGVAAAAAEAAAAAREPRGERVAVTAERGGSEGGERVEALDGLPSPPSSPEVPLFTLEPATLVSFSHRRGGGGDSTEEGGNGTSDTFHHHHHHTRSTSSPAARQDAFSSPAAHQNASRSASHSEIPLSHSEYGGGDEPTSRSFPSIRALIQAASSAAPPAAPAASSSSAPLASASASAAAASRASAASASAAATFSPPPRSSSRMLQKTGRNSLSLPDSVLSRAADAILAESRGNRAVAGGVEIGGEVGTVGWRYAAGSSGLRQVEGGRRAEDGEGRADEGETTGEEGTRRGEEGAKKEADPSAVTPHAAPPSADPSPAVPPPALPPTAVGPASPPFHSMVPLLHSLLAQLDSTGLSGGKEEAEGQQEGESEGVVGDGVRWEGARERDKEVEAGELGQRVRKRDAARELEKALRTFLGTIGESGGEGGVAVAGGSVLGSGGTEGEEREGGEEARVRGREGSAGECRAPGDDGSGEMSGERSGETSGARLGVVGERGVGVGGEGLGSGEEEQGKLCGSAIGEEGERGGDEERKGQQEERRGVEGHQVTALDSNLRSSVSSSFESNSRLTLNKSVDGSGDSSLGSMLGSSQASGHGLSAGCGDGAVVDSSSRAGEGAGRLGGDRLPLVGGGVSIVGDGEGGGGLGAEGKEREDGMGKKVEECVEEGSGKKTQREEGDEREGREGGEEKEEREGDASSEEEFYEAEEGGDGMSLGLGEEEDAVVDAFLNYQDEDEGTVGAGGAERAEGAEGADGTEGAEGGEGGKGAEGKEGSIYEASRKEGPAGGEDETRGAVVGVALDDGDGTEEGKRQGGGEEGGEGAWRGAVGKGEERGREEGKREEVVRSGLNGSEERKDGETADGGETRVEEKGAIVIESSLDGVDGTITAVTAVTGFGKGVEVEGETVAEEEAEAGRTIHREAEGEEGLGSGERRGEEGGEGRGEGKGEAGEGKGEGKGEEGEGKEEGKAGTKSDGAQGVPEEEPSSGVQIGAGELIGATGDERTEDTGLNSASCAEGRSDGESERDSSGTGVREGVEKLAPGALMLPDGLTPAEDEERAQTAAAAAAAAAAVAAAAAAAVAVPAVQADGKEALLSPHSSAQEAAAAAAAEEAAEEAPVGAAAAEATVAGAKEEADTLSGRAPSQASASQAREGPLAAGAVEADRPDVGAIAPESATPGEPTGSASPGGDDDSPHTGPVSHSPPSSHPSPPSHTSPQSHSSSSTNTPHSPSSKWGAGGTLPRPLRSSSLKVSSSLSLSAAGSRLMSRVRSVTRSRSGGGSAVMGVTGGGGGGSGDGGVGAGSGEGGSPGGVGRDEGLEERGEEGVMGDGLSGEGGGKGLDQVESGGGGRAVVAGLIDGDVASRVGGAVGGGRDGEEGVESREGRDGGKTGGDDRNDKGGKGLEKGGDPKQLQLHQQQLQLGGDTKHADVDNSTSPLHTMPTHSKFSVRGLTIQSPKGDGSPPLLSDVSLEVPRGEITVLVGPSGSGKTTLLRTLNRLTEPPRNSVFLDGTDITSSKLPVITLRRRVGMLFQTPSLFDGTVADNIRFGPNLEGRQLPDEKIHELLSLSGLEPSFAERDSRSLSGGQAQRVALARALANDPEVLLLDEPTSALDPAATLKVEQAVQTLCRERGLTAVWVSHSAEQVTCVRGDWEAVRGKREGRDVEGVLRVSHSLVLLHNGAVADALPTALLRSPDAALRAAHRLVHEFLGGLLQGSADRE
ncbi:unnamed protein product [Closterium sp. Naga37s-1]|nr:unnamed protein product [Closterium sp. Naga37s-1]